MRAALLRHRITFQELSQVSDDMGSFTDTWVDVVTMWGAVWAISAKEHITAAKIEMETTHRIRIRYYAGLDSAMRIRFGTRYFKIQSIINPDERNRTLDMLVIEEL